VGSPDVPVISGSMRTGQAISAVGARQLKRYGLELGGKTLHLLFDDADLDAALHVLVHFALSRAAAGMDRL
jgi:betaine-aldehyde dehydrogenase